MTQIEQTIGELWELLRADSPEGARARRRAAATSAMSVSVLAMLVAVGLAGVALVVVAMVATASCLLVAAALFRRHGGRLRGLSALLRARGAEITRRTIRAAGDSSTRAAAWSGPVLRRARFETSARVRTAHLGVSAATRSLVSATAASAAEARGAATSARDRARASVVVDQRRRAVRANTLGVQLRREGDSAAAAEQHQLALELFRAIGDRRAEALTLNTLALALERTGDPRAIELFEEAATILGELGDEESEGQVIANLALAFRRRGKEQESDEALETALAKLEPQSNAYRKAERLRRAS
jgi:tetratricopeptide (TPR) repeat protein